MSPTAILGLAILAFAYVKLPYHSAFEREKPLRQRVGHLMAILRSPLALVAYAFMACIMFGNFMIVPNISAHVQMNLGYPRSQLGLLYFVAGMISFFSMRLAGKMIDRSSSTHTAIAFTVLMLAALFFGFIWYQSGVPVLIIFVVFMVGSSGRMVSAQTLSSKIPSADERGAFMSVQSAVMHFASATGAYYSSLVLVEKDGLLLHVPRLGIFSAGLALIIPLLFWWVERQVKRRPASPTAVMPAAQVD